MTTTKQIKNWKELIEFIDNVDPTKNSIFLSGWVMNIGKQKKKYKHMYFSVIPNSEMPAIPVEDDVQIE